MRKSKVSFDIQGIEELKDSISDIALPACRSALEEVMEDLRRCAAGFAPIDTGHLSSSGGMQVRKTKSQLIGEVTFSTTADTYDYALRMHEGIYTPRKQNTGGSSKFGTVAWRTGSKYLSEPFRQLLPSYIEHIGDVLREELN